MTWHPTYRCPVCATGDPDAYLRCYRPDCPDGRDHRIVINHRQPAAPVAEPSIWRGIIISSLITAALMCIVYLSIHGI